jgi:hypothetical protein
MIEVGRDDGMLERGTAIIISCRRVRSLCSSLHNNDSGDQPYNPKSTLKLNNAPKKIDG